MKPSQKSSQPEPSSTIFLILVIILLSFVAITESLMCYQCAGTSSTDECVVDLQGMLNSSRNYTLHPYYAKNCTNTNKSWKYCMIETYETNGGYTLYHRGCHDGKTFSSKIKIESRFENLPPNNDSTCAMVESISKLVCYRFCDTDFCNGPQPNSASSVFGFMDGPMRVGLLTFEMTITLSIGWISGFSLI